MDARLALMGELADLEFKVYGPAHGATIDDSVKHLSLLMATGDLKKAEALGCRLDELLAEHTDENDRRRLVVSSMLGEAIAGQQRFEEAEPHLLKGLELIDDPNAGERLRNEALQRVVNLYEAWDRPEQARKWRVKASEPF